jgi:hypothetical protein
MSWPGKKRCTTLKTIKSDLQALRNSGDKTIPDSEIEMLQNAVQALLNTYCPNA